MGRRLILDTVVVIDYERGRVDRRAFDDDDLTICAISVAEFLVGVELASSPERRTARLDAFVGLREFVDVLDYTEQTAAHHAALIAFARRSGRPRGLHDLVVAAHAAETGRTVVSRDSAARFGDLPGVTAITPA